MQKIKHEKHFLGHAILPYLPAATLIVDKNLTQCKTLKHQKGIWLIKFHMSCILHSIMELPLLRSILSKLLLLLQEREEEDEGREVEFQQPWFILSVGIVIGAIVTNQFNIIIYRYVFDKTNCDRNFQNGLSIIFALRLMFQGPNLNSKCHHHCDVVSSCGLKVWDARSSTGGLFMTCSFPNEVL